MPQLAVRKPTDVPTPSTVSRAVREQQLLYEGFIRQVGGDVGQLNLDDGEQLRSVKTRLRRAATRAGTEIDMWDADGKIYFKPKTATVRRGRPRKTA